MPACTSCVPWNQPRAMQPRLTQHGVALTFEEWLLYRLHIEIHQERRWGGELEELTQALHRNPAFRLDSPRLAA